MAVRQDILLRCPTERVEPPRVIPKEARFYSPAELKRLFGLVEGHWLELIVKLAGSLGLRREEICGLRWSSVDLELRKLHIKEGPAPPPGRRSSRRRPRTAPPTASSI